MDVYGADAAVSGADVMSWIKLEKSTVDKPEVHQIATGLNLDPDLVMGKLVRLWVWVDGVSSDGRVSGASVELLDRIAFQSGFGEMLVRCGWLEEVADGLFFPNFDRHMSKSAKRRALTAERVAVSRASGRVEKPEAGVPKKARKEKRGASGAKSGAGAYTVGFLRFWEVYPRKVGKRKVFGLWKRERLESRVDEVVLSVEGHKRCRQWQEEQGKFIPLPHTFLNEGRYEDPPEADVVPGLSRPQLPRGT